MYYLAGFALPGTKADRRHLKAIVQRETTIDEEIHFSKFDFVFVFVFGCIRMRVCVFAVSCVGHNRLRFLVFRDRTIKIKVDMSPKPSETRNQNRDRPRTNKTLKVTPNPKP